MEKNDAKRTVNFLTNNVIIIFSQAFLLFCKKIVAMKKILLFIVLAVIGYAAVAQSHTANTRSTLLPQMAPFYHGVASGDPLADRVILWTRVTTNDPTVTVTWEIATDTLFSNIVATGTGVSDSSKDYCVKVDAAGLQPNSWYYYRFRHNGVNSIIGRTRTAPNTTVNNLRFAVVSCSNFQHGFFNAYRDITNKNDIDAVLHLGDYYYEYGIDDYTPQTDPNRKHEPQTEILTLGEYRVRHSQYKLDPDLRDIHQQFPFITVWDDHETANDSWYGGAQNHTDGTEGDWYDRKNAGRRAYFEWMPIRDLYNGHDTIHREMSWGGLVDLIMLDTRLEGRQQQAGTSGATVTDTNRTILGKPQLEWFKNKLSASTSKWKLIGNQVMIAPLRIAGVAVNQDQWDGYPAERDKVLGYIESNNINNCVFLTGDIHTSWANDVPRNTGSYTSSTGAGSTATEFVCTSVTSSSFLTFGVSDAVIKLVNPYIKYAELSKRGYILFDVNANRVQGDWVYMSTIGSRTFTSSAAASWQALDGENHLRTASALTPRSGMPALAPQLITTGIKKVKNNLVTIEVSPNPFYDKIALQYYLFAKSNVNVYLSDITGKQIKNFSMGEKSEGLHETELIITDLPAATYLLTITDGNQTFTKKLVKR